MKATCHTICMNGWLYSKTMKMEEEKSNVIVAHNVQK